MLGLPLLFHKNSITELESSELTPNSCRTISASLSDDPCKKLIRLETVKIISCFPNLIDVSFKGISQSRMVSLSLEIKQNMLYDTYFLYIFEGFLCIREIFPDINFLKKTLNFIMLVSSNVSWRTRLFIKKMSIRFAIRIASPNACFRLRNFSIFA